MFCATSRDIDAAVEYKGVFYVDSNCRPGRPNPSAQDDELVSWLWEWSAQVCRAKE